MDASSRSFLIVAGLIAVAVAACSISSSIRYLSGERKAEKRKARSSRARAGAAHSRRRKDPTRQRDASRIADSLKEIEQRSDKKKKITLETRIAQAGLDLGRNEISSHLPAVAALVVALLLVRRHRQCARRARGLGHRRLRPAQLGLVIHAPNGASTKFVDEFPGAVDIIIRGVKAGLPLGDCLRIIATEAPEPVRGEFRQIVEAQTHRPVGRRGRRAHAPSACRSPKRISSRSSSPSSRSRAAISSEALGQSFARAARPQEDEATRSRRCPPRPRPRP